MVAKTPEPKGKLEVVKDILNSKKMLKNLIWAALALGLVALILAPKSCPTPWGEYKQGPIWNGEK